MRRAGVIVAMMVATLLVAADLRAQGAQSPPARARQGRAAAAADGQPISLVELQRLFDAYFILQAQEALKLDDAKYAGVLPKLKALQDVRRRHDQERRQIVAELAKMTAPAAVMDEAHVRDTLRTLQELESRSAAEQRLAYDTIDQVLDVRQQARFRVFEQNMERRKFELMLRARRGGVSGAPGAPGAGR
jgi:hypothetical protein